MRENEEEETQRREREHLPASPNANTLQSIAAKSAITVNAAESDGVVGGDLET